MKSNCQLFLLLLTGIFIFTSCKDSDIETKKGFLTAHTWKYERVSVNGSVNWVKTYPDERFKFNADGSYLKTHIDTDGNRSAYEGTWELNKNATRLTYKQDGMSGTAKIRELTATSLKITRDDTPDLLLEFDLIPE